MVAPAGTPGTGPQIVDTATFCDYQTLDQMAFHLTDHGFQMQLSSYVPRLLAGEIESVVDTFLSSHGLNRREVRHWGIHPGSARILDYTQEKLGLPPQALQASRDVLFQFGNMSSATILFILQELQKNARPGDLGMLLAFGPGLTIESTLLQG